MVGYAFAVVVSVPTFSRNFSAKDVRFDLSLIMSSPTVMLIAIAQMAFRFTFIADSAPLLHTYFS